MQQAVQKDIYVDLIRSVDEGSTLHFTRPAKIKEAIDYTNRHQFPAETVDLCNVAYRDKE